MLNQGGISVQSNRVSPPDLAELHKLLSQALEGRGQHTQAAWHSADRNSGFFLDVISNASGGDPKWRLFRDQRGNRQLLFDYPSCDVLLVHNFIAASCAEAEAKARGHSKLAQTPVAVAPPPRFQSGEESAPLASTAASTAASAASAQPSAPTITNVAKTLPSLASIAAQPAAPAPTGSATVGDLTRTPLAQILQGLRSAKLTGKLEIHNKLNTALLYVQDGLLIDATAADTEGDEAIIELLTWKEGQFVFEPRVLRNSQTVHQPIESLMAQSKQLSERMGYLRNNGMQPTSVLIPNLPNLTDTEFIQRASSGAPIGVADILKFYRHLNGQQTMEELLRTAQLPRVQFVNILYHLVINGLVQISNEIVLQKSTEIKPRVIEASAIQGVMMSLRRLETGMFIYPAFLYFLEQEYFRCYRSKTPLSVIVFEMGLLSANFSKQPLSPPAILDAVLRISQLKRHVDLLAHYDTADYALLLPNTKANGAQIFAKRIVKALTDTPLAGEIDANHLSLAFGCASMPEDFTDLGPLLGAADSAMTRSRITKKPVIMYREIKPITL